MTKVAIISRHAVINYGSFFQSLALERIIQSLGYDAYTIDYVNISEKSWRQAFIDIQNSRWNNNIFRKMIFYFINVPNRIFQYYTFSSFRRKELHLSREYNSHRDLVKSCPDADIFCTGSDQVWNETINNELDSAYFLTFTHSNNKISYAASFGKGTLNKSRLDFVVNALKQYKAISVREDSGVKLLEQLGLNGEQVLDPTFLLTGNEWRKLIGKSTQSIKKYILIYQIHKNKSLIDYAKKYANYKGYDVFYISVSFTKIVRGVKFKFLPSYKEVLALFDNAECIITDSFHATAFSINFNKQFVTMLPPISVSRNKSILRLFGLENRVISNTDDFNALEEPIDYTIVNAIMDVQRKKSIEWLRKTLKNVESSL